MTTQSGTAPPSLKLNAYSGAQLDKAETSFHPSPEEAQLVDHAGVFLQVPLQIMLERTSTGYWICTSPGIMTHGAGDTRTESIVDFLSMLEDLYSDLDDSRDILASHLIAELSYLDKILVKRG
jgi:hypothetical protein